MCDRIAIMHHGELIALEATGALVERLGTRGVIIHLREPLADAPRGAGWTGAPASRAAAGSSSLTLPPPQTTGDLLGLLVPARPAGRRPGNQARRPGGGLSADHQGYPDQRRRTAMSDPRLPEFIPLAAVSHPAAEGGAAFPAGRLADPGDAGDHRRPLSVYLRRHPRRRASACSRGSATPSSSSPG